MRRFFDWVQSPLPLHGLAIFFVGVVLLYVLEWVFMGALYLAFGAIPDEWRRMVGVRGWVIVSLVAWGVWRAWEVNPAFQDRYLRWLQMTPWTPDRPLPFGTVDLMPQDALLLLMAMVVFWMWPQSIYVPLAFLLPYSIILTMLNRHLQQHVAAAAAIALFALLPLSFTWASAKWAPAVIAGATALIAHWGWRRGLQDFPWNGESRRLLPEDQRQVERATAATWPLVHPWRDLNLTQLVSWRHTVLAAALIAWIAAVTIHSMRAFITISADAGMAEEVIHNNAARWAIVVTFIAGFVAAVWRLLRYISWCALPIDPAGRWSTGRLLIPGYDKVFLAPIAALATSAVLPRVLLTLSAPPSLTTFISVFAVVVAAMGIGPTLATWSLTGEYRMVDEQRRSRAQ